MGLLVSAAFFARFWRETRDRFFLWLAFAFLLLSLERVGLVIFQPEAEDKGSFYVLRLVAFAAIPIAILRKNRSKLTLD